MFSHIFHAVKIQSVDTDVFILGIYFWNKLARLGCLGLWFEGSYKNKYIRGCHLAAESLGENISRILPALHALTGCDSTSRLGSKKKVSKEIETVCTYIFSQQKLLINFGIN